MRFASKTKPPARAHPRRAGSAPASSAKSPARAGTAPTATAAKPATAKPATAKPATAKPATAKPATAKPATAKPAIANLDTTPGAGADPAAIVAWALDGARRALPHADAVAAQLGHPVAGIIALGGQRARRACELLRARAFAVDNIVAFAEDAPPLGRVLHEVAHVLQRGAQHAPRVRFTAGSLAIAAPGERAEREAARFARAPRPASLSAAPRRLYRDGDDEATATLDATAKAEGDALPLDATGERIPRQDIETKYDHFRFIHTKRMLRIARESKYRPIQIDEKSQKLPKKIEGAPPPPSVFGLRNAERVFTTFYAFSSPDAYLLDQVWQDMQSKAAVNAPQLPPAKSTLSDNLVDARKTDAFRSAGVVIANRRYVVRGVGPETQTQPVYFALVGPAHAGGFTTPPDFIQSLRAGSEAKSSPAEILQSYQGVIADIKAAHSTASARPVWPTALDTTVTTITNQLPTMPAGLNEQWDIVDGHRDVLINTIVATWTDIGQLHHQVISTKGLNDNSGLKGNLFERWIQANAKGNPDTSREPIFAESFTKEAGFTRSDKLLKIRRGDGYLQVDDKAVIAEAKAYKQGPANDKDDLVLQMQDYALIIQAKPTIYGYLKKGKNDYQEVAFTAVYYYFSDANVAKLWVPFLDKYLPGLYKVIEPQSFKATAEPGEALEFYRKLIPPLTKLGKIDGKKLADLAARIDVSLGKPKGTEAELTAIATDADTVAGELATAIAAGYTELDALYDAVLTPSGSKALFVAPHLAMIGRIFEAWVKTNLTTFDLGKAKNPLRGQVADVTPLFTAATRATPFESDDVKGLVAGTRGVLLRDNAEVAKDTLVAAIVLDLSALAAGAQPARPSEDDQKRLRDFHRLISGKVRSYYQSKEGTSNIVVVREFTAVELVFSDVAAADPWSKPAGTALPGTKEYKVSPDPKGARTFSLFVVANPRIELPIKDADQLEHSFSAADLKIAAASGAAQAGDKAAGVTITEAKIKLKTQRSAEIDSGSITMAIGAKDVVKSEKPTTQQIKPAVEPPAPAKPGAKPVHGNLDNKVGGVSSALDKLLKRVQTDAKLVDGGIAATIRILPGPSGIPRIDLEAAEVTVTYHGGDKLKVAGSIGLRHASGKLSGALKISWEKGALKILGSVTAQPGLVDGLEAFTGEIEYGRTTTEATADGAPGQTAETLKIRVKEAKVRKAMKGVTFFGAAKNLEYDAITGLFSGQIEKFGAEMGPFGTATGAASFKDSALSEVSLTYESPEIKFPRAKPIITGKLTTTIGYKDGKFSGGLTGNAVVAIGALQKLGPKQAGQPTGLGLAVNVQLSPDGAWSGTIGTTTPILIGSHFKIPKIELALAENGAVSGTFGLTVYGIKYLDEATAECAIDKDGFRVKSFSVTGSIPKTDTSRFWGSVTAKWNGTSFAVSVDAYVKIRDNLIGHGTLTYDGATDTISGSLEVLKVQVLGPKSTYYELFKLDKQIVLFTVYGIIGLYLDVGVKLGFDIGYDVWLKPTLALDGFSLKTFKFKSIAATMVLGGSLSAALTLEPKIGLGLYVFSPSIVRAGGGLKIPITAKATVDAAAELHARYARVNPNDENSAYELAAAAQISLVIKFGINAAIKAYAEFVVLDGAYTLPWEETLATFPLMPERELMRYTLDFGKPIAKGADPRTGPGEKPAEGATQPVTTGGTRKETPADKTVDQNPSAAAPPGKTPEEPQQDDGGGFSLKSLLDNVKKLPVYKKIESLIDSATGLFKSIGKFFKAIYDTVKKWIGDALDFIETAMKEIKAKGLFGWLRDFIDARIRKLSPTLADIVLPILDALKTSEDQLRDALLGASPANSLEGFLELAFKIIPILLGGAWDSAEALVAALYKLAKKVPDYAVGLINQLIQAGKLGIIRGTGVSSYAYKIHIGPVQMSGRDDAASRVIATLLNELLLFVGASHTHGEDFWVE